MKKRLNDTAALRTAAPTQADALQGRSTRTVEVEPIGNGFIRTVREHGPEGYKEAKTYHQEQPSLNGSARSGTPRNTGSLAKAVHCVKR